MKMGRSIIDILSDNLMETTEMIAKDLNSKNANYRILNEEMESIIEEYPRILELTFEEDEITLSNEELKAMQKLFDLHEEKRMFEEEQIYIQGIKDCFEFMLSISDFDFKKVNNK